MGVGSFSQGLGGDKTLIVVTHARMPVGPIMGMRIGCIRKAKLGAMCWRSGMLITAVFVSEERGRQGRRKVS